MSDGWTHEYAFPIPAPVDRLFRALTTREELEAWFAEHAEVEARAGGPYRFWGRHTVGLPGAGDTCGTVTALEPDARLAFEWVVCGTPSTVEIVLAPEEIEGMGPGTKVSVRHELHAGLNQPRPKELIDDWWRLSLGNLMAHSTGHGQVMRPDFSDGSPEIRMDMHVDAPAAAVFRALTSPEGLRAWMGAPDPEVEPRVGGRFSLGWTYTVDGKEMTAPPMEILEFEPDARLTISWPDWRGDPDVPMQRVTWALEPEEGGTRVHLTHAGFVRAADVSDYPFGWGHFLSEMAKVAVGFAD